MTSATAQHEAAHLVAALALGLRVVSASIRRGACRVVMDPPARLSAALLRANAIVAAAGPVSDLRHNARGWQGYRLDSPDNDVRKVGELCARASALGPRFDVADALAAARTILRHHGVALAIAAWQLQHFETLGASDFQTLTPLIDATRDFMAQAAA